MRNSKSKRPTCAHCGNAYGQRQTRSETVRWPIGEEMPRYSGNGIVVKTGQPYRTTDRATVRAVTALSINPEIRAAQERQIADAPAVGHMAATREIWDGESYSGGYKPFCTLRCALDYARKAFNAINQRRGAA